MEETHDFEIVNLQELPEKTKEHVLWQLFQIYIRFGKHFIDVYPDYKKIVLKCGKAVVVMKNGRPVGAATFEEDKNKFHINEMWAQPSKEFVKKRNVTIGLFLHHYIAAMAEAKHKELTNSGYVYTGKKMGRRFEGIIPRVPILKRKTRRPK